MLMERWSSLGKFIASHMPMIVPICVAAGVLFPQVFGTIKPIVPYLFAIMTFQGSLNNTTQQLFYVFRHPKDLVVILLVSQLFMPLLAFALAQLFFGSNVNLVTGILLEYSVPVAVVSFMWVGMFNGNGPLGLSVILVSTVISPFTIPATLQLLLGQSIQMDALGMVFNMILMVAVPALAGMLVNEFTHGWGHEKLSGAISPACRVFLVLIIIANSTSMSPYVLHMTWQRAAVALFILVYACSGYLWGILFARLLHQPHDTLITMSFDCGLRNISSGAVIASQYFPGEVVYPVMCGTIFQQMLAAVFGAVIERIFPAEENTPKAEDSELPAGESIDASANASAQELSATR